MKIAYCNGGLGNQTFQYIFSRFVELEAGAPCYLDDSFFFREHVIHNGFELPEVFPDARPRLLSECFDEDVWQYMVSRGGIPQQLKDAGEDYLLIAETDNFSFDGNIVPIPVNQYSPWIAHARGNIYYHGYWINKDWLKNNHWNVLRKELQFTTLTGDRNKRYEEAIEETNSVALHIRRGDFVELGWDAPAEKYQTAVHMLKEQVEAPHFFIFSDDLIWCRKNLEQFGLSDGEVTFVEGNTGGKNYIDMQLMSYCKNAVLVTSSSFSYLAVLLNRNENVTVCNGTGRQT